MDFKLEVIGFTIENCAAAQTAGASRIELCDNPAEGGTTPSHGFIKAARALLTIPLFPIIRPRGGDFLYTDAEFEIMKTDIILCKKLGCDAVVFGILLADGTVDKSRCSELVQLAYPMSATFHRAFDRVENPARALEDIIDMGFERILTSGLAPLAMDGAATIAALMKQADNRIVIMPGSGVTSHNIGELREITGATEFHTSARTWLSSKMEFTNAALQEDLHSVGVEVKEIEKMIAFLKKST
jgi:copper homeostasis protein